MGVLTLGNPDLKPEESKNWDISYEGEWGKTFGKLTYFHNDIENMISTHTVGSGRSGWSQYYNIDGTTKTHGVELTLGRKLSDRWDTKLTSNWTSASNKSASAEASAHGVDGIADNITTLQLTYDDHKTTGWNATIWEQWSIITMKAIPIKPTPIRPLTSSSTVSSMKRRASLPVSTTSSIKKSTPSTSTAAFGARALKLHSNPFFHRAMFRTDAVRAWLFS